MISILNICPLLAGLKSEIVSISFLFMVHSCLLQNPKLLDFKLMLFCLFSYNQKHVHCPTPVTTSQYSIYMQHLHPAYDKRKKESLIFLKTKQLGRVQCTYIIYIQAWNLAQLRCTRMASNQALFN